MYIILLLLLYTSYIMWSRKNFYSCITCSCGFLRPVNWKYLYPVGEIERKSRYDYTDPRCTIRVYDDTVVREFIVYLRVAPGLFFRDILLYLLLVIIIYIWLGIQFVSITRRWQMFGSVPIPPQYHFSAVLFHRIGCLFPKLFSFQIVQDNM